MQLTPSRLSTLYGRAHDYMRSMDGMQPQEAFDELLKYLFWKEATDQSTGRDSSSQMGLLRESPVDLRQQLKQFGRKLSAQALLHEADFQLSDPALNAVHQLFREVDLSAVQFDIRSAALREFLRPDLRRGLGIFLTPDNVVRTMVEIAAPLPSDRVYDPACGSGTFLIETLKYWRSRDQKRRRPFELWGSDKSARMLLLADLNLGHLKDVVFHRELSDALAPAQASWPTRDTFDVILTNPPFGVVLESRSFDFTEFETCRDRNGTVRSRQQSEVMFIEQCLKFLRPGGKLGIVLPKSVITNAAFVEARAAIDKLAFVTSIISLPPETFQIGGTQTTTCAVFFQKYGKREQAVGLHRIAAASITNVGYDSTGRARTGEQLSALPKELESVLASERDNGSWKLLAPVEKGATLSSLSDLLTAREYRPSSAPKRRLGDYLEVACTGRTPPRASYTDSGVFLVKVGNLTGQGIDWIARERNFASVHRGLLLQKHDIVLTSSAHSPVYIAKKVDIVTTIPSFVGGKASFVGEVMMLRVKPGELDPWFLLAFLRSETARSIIQRMVRGQTAHLHPDDVRDLLVPEQVFSQDAAMKQIREVLREESETAERQNVLAHQQASLIHQLFESN